MILEDKIINDMKEIWPTNWRNILDYFERKEDDWNGYDELIKTKIQHPKLQLLNRIEGRKYQLAFEQDVLTKIIPKNMLLDGVVYLAMENTENLCRHVSEARWDEKQQTFVYERYKWGRTFEDTIEHFADVVNQNTAGFTPIKPK